MGEDRSIRAVAQKLGKSSALIGRWSSPKEWKWQERLEALARYQDEQERKAHNEAIKRMKERQARLGEGMQTIGARKLARMLETTDPTKVGVTEANAALDALGLTETMRMLQEGTKLERVARGEPETITENRNVESYADAVTAAWEARLAAEGAAGKAKADQGAEENQDADE
jgi:hypothetical protein